MVVYAFVKGIGCFVIVTVTAVNLLPARSLNVENINIAEDDNCLLKEVEKNIN